MSDELTEGKTEKFYDRALSHALENDQAFADWFFQQTKFEGEGAVVDWCRSDHPWTTVTFTSVDPSTGEEIEIRRESETDVLVVYLGTSGKRYGIHIENKLAKGSFGPYQPEMYKHRATKWLNDPKYGNYSDFDTVLVAPKEFYERNEAHASEFGSFVSYESIAKFVPDFAQTSAT